MEHRDGNKQIIRLAPLRWADRGLAWALGKLIRGYQLAISPALHLLGGGTLGCRFEPTCSRYALECLRIHVFPKALYLIVRRVGRCHPFHPGGFDPVPPGAHAAAGKETRADCTDAAEHAASEKS